MKETPILMKPEMIRAILSGQKTQTRRFIKCIHKLVDIATPSEWNVGRADDRMIPFEEWGPKRGIHLFRIDTGSVIGMPCPYGRKGDLLWVKEGFFLYGFYNKPTYKADFSEYQLGSLKCEHSSTGLRFGNWDFHWKSPLFMPKKYARIWLELTADPIPQRIQEITEEDADAEGFGGDFPHKVFPDIFFNDMGHLSIPECFGILFDTYNGPGTWDKNPWVWKLEFKRIEK